MSQLDNIDERTPLLPSSSSSTDLSDVGSDILVQGTKSVPEVTEGETPGSPESDQDENATRVSPVMVVAVLTIGAHFSFQTILGR